MTEQGVSFGTAEIMYFSNDPAFSRQLGQYALNQVGAGITLPEPQQAPLELAS